MKYTAKPVKVSLVHAPWETVECVTLVIPLFEEDKPDTPFAKRLNERLRGLLGELVSTSEWKATFGQEVTVYRPGQCRAARLVLIGAGKQAAYDAAASRTLAMLATYRAKDRKPGLLAILGRTNGIPTGLFVQGTTEGVILGNHRIDEYKTENQSKSLAGEASLVLEEITPSSDLEVALARGHVIAQAANRARSLVNEPGNTINPAVLAERALEMASKSGLQVQVFDEAEMERQGMKAILAVGQGSEHPPRFIVLRHAGAPSADDPPIVFVGKGVTFDSGGLSLKPAESMADMKSDKAGACAVMAAMRAIAELEVPLNVVGLIPAAENLPGGRAQRPGDVIHSMSGKTIEVLNTDAEGRLLLADALHYGRTLNPRFILDLATLTGAIVVALGSFRAGLFCNNEELYGRVTEAARVSGERLWRMPLDDDYRKELDSQIADIKNVGSRSGGAITAAKFLEEFVDKQPWCHLDMAGVDNFPENEEIKGPTGFGTRTLVELALQSAGER